MVIMIQHGSGGLIIDRVGAERGAGRRKMLKDFDSCLILTRQTDGLLRTTSLVSKVVTNHHAASF